MLVMNCKYGCTGDVPTNVTKQDLMIIARHLLQQPIEYGTKPQPISEHILCFVDYNMMNDIRGCDSFIDIKDYPDTITGFTFTNEIGMVGNLRIIICDMSPTIKDETIKASQNGEDIYKLKCCRTFEGKMPYGKENLWATLLATKACKIYDYR
jgi:N4-gp56 family major capsid protein